MKNQIQNLERFRSIARFTNRFYVIFEINKSSNFDSFIFAIFTSIHDSKYITLKKLVRKLQTIHHWKSHIVEKISRSASLKKFARKFQIRLNSLKYKTENTNDCCKKMLKIQFSRMCCNQNSIDIIWRKQN